MRDDEGAVLPLGLEIVPLGAPDRETVERVAAQISRRVAVPCRLADRARGIELPRLPHRDQLDADRLLVLAQQLERRSGHWTVGVAGEDMGHPIFTFFFGRARHHGDAVVIALHRLRPEFYGMPRDPDLVARRAGLEVIHELGHVAGLAHCDDNACVMRFCPSVEGIDNRGVTFCPRCAPNLPPAFAPSTSRTK
jgi:archaemetzincin